MLPSVHVEISNPALYQLFVMQLKKDFENSNASIEFIDDLKPDYNLILHSIYTELQILISDSKFRLNQLLYRIDISEQQINKLSKAKPDVNFLEIVSELIIKRTLQKVVIKEMHKSNTKKINE